LSAKFPDMKKASENDDGNVWLRRCFEYEATHEIAFASPRVLLEAPSDRGNGQGSRRPFARPSEEATGPTRPQNERSELIRG